MIRSVRGAGRAASHRHEPTPASPAAAEPEDWERQFDYAGIPYYVNLLTNEVQWEVRSGSTAWRWSRPELTRLVWLPGGPARPQQEPSQEQLRETLRQRQQYLDAGVALGNLREQDEGQPQLSSAGPSAAGTERRTASRDGPRKGQEVGGGDKRVASAKATRREEGKGEDEEEPWPEMQVYPKPDFESLLHMDEAIRKGVRARLPAVRRPPVDPAHTSPAGGGVTRCRGEDEGAAGGGEARLRRAARAAGAAAHGGAAAGDARARAAQGHAVAAPRAGGAVAAQAGADCAPARPYAPTCHASLTFPPI